GNKINGMGTSDEAQSIKAEGNDLFKAGDYVGALEKYNSALKLTDEENHKAVLLNNRAAANIKLRRYEDAVKDATEVLEMTPSDVKALYRRSQAYEALGRIEEAFRDARKVLHLDPKNTAVQPSLRRLSQAIQEIAKENASTSNKVGQMLGVVGDPTLSLELKVQAGNNLVVIAREKAGAEAIVKSDGLAKCLAAMRSLKSPEFSLACIRIFAELCKKSTEWASLVLKEFGLPMMVNQFVSKDNQQVTAVQYLFQTMINVFSGMDSKDSKKPDKELMKKHEQEIDSIMLLLVKSVSSRVMTALGRDAILELLTKNVDYERLNWGMKLVDSDGLVELLEVASELEEIRYESSMDITSNTRPNCSVLLERIYFCMDYDRAKEKYREKVTDYVNGKLRDLEIESKVRVTSAITALLLGPLDVGNQCLATPGVVEMMLAMAGSEDEVQQQQRHAMSRVLHSARCVPRMKHALTGLIFTSASSAIKHHRQVNVSWCTQRPASRRHSFQAFRHFRQMILAFFSSSFLVNSKNDKDLRKWAAEGLAFLTLDAEVKEDLIADKNAIHALIDLAKVEQKTVLYGVATTLVNLTNSYEKQEVLPELKELAKFAKQHVPEEHELDAKEHVEKRIKLLAESGVTVALVALSTTESRNSREMIARVFNAICEQQELRGHVVQQGGAKALLKLAAENTPNGKFIAAQALARLGITINPEVAFPGQRAVEVIRPLMSLLHPECTALQNFESLMALTNLATISEGVRSHIIKDGGITTVENYCYEDHVMLKRAGVQHNCSLFTQVVRIYEKGDRVKYLTLCLEDEDYDTSQAAAGALAMLTSVSDVACQKVVEVKDWVEIFGGLAAHKDEALQHRGVCILHNLVHSKRDVAERLVGSSLLEVLLAVTQVEGAAASDKVRKLAQETLSKAEQWKLIQKSSEQDEPQEEPADVQ
ncbi:heat shock protein 70 (HSP70)-interacting protein, putative, partial [Ixodes scapularis]|uniref:Heat shock protein 70 (HSP70)-interacting protein, putative n=2 Tax=Ixodes scapularis TaxID=6945 RepID=A0A1S4LSS8_IXOSC